MKKIFFLLLTATLIISCQDDLNEDFSEKPENFTEVQAPQKNGEIETRTPQLCPTGTANALDGIHHVINSLMGCSLDKPPCTECSTPFDICYTGELIDVNNACIDTDALADFAVTLPGLLDCGDEEVSDVCAVVTETYLVGCTPEMQLCVKGSAIACIVGDPPPVEPCEDGWEIFSGPDTNTPNPCDIWIGVSGPPGAQVLVNGVVVGNVFEIIGGINSVGITSITIQYEGGECSLPIPDPLC